MQRYDEFTDIIPNSEGKRRFSSLYYPKVPRKASDKWIITKSSDRLELLAFEEYGDTRYWVIIAKANKLFNATFLICSHNVVRQSFISLRVSHTKTD